MANIAKAAIYIRILNHLYTFQMCAVFTKGPFLEKPGNADPVIILKKTGCIISMNEKLKCHMMLIAVSSESLKKRNEPKQQKLSLSFLNKKIFRLFPSEKI